MPYKASAKNPKPNKIPMKINTRFDETRGFPKSRPNHTATGKNTNAQTNVRIVSEDIVVM